MGWGEWVEWGGVGWGGRRWGGAGRGGRIDIVWYAGDFTTVAQTLICRKRHWIVPYFKTELTRKPNFCMFIY